MYTLSTIYTYSIYTIVREYTAQKRAAERAAILYTFILLCVGINIIFYRWKFSSTGQKRPKKNHYLFSQGTRKRKDNDIDIVLRICSAINGAC